MDKTVSFALFTIAIMIAPGCTSKPSYATKQKLQYQCDRGTRFSADFSADGNSANITLEDGSQHTLPAAVTGSGFMYSNGRYELRGKDKEAMWSVGRMAAEHCKVLP